MKLNLNTRFKRILKGCAHASTVMAAFLAFSSVARAQNEEAVDVEMRTELPIEVKKPAGAIAQIEMQHFSFVRADQAYFGSEENVSEVSTFGVGLKRMSGSLQFEGRGFYVPQDESAYFNIAELSYNGRIDEDHFWLGRHRHTWSQADEFWQAGAWQPRFRWDGFYPVQEGLTGFFYEHRVFEKTRVMILASPLFIPDMASDYSEKDGKIVANSPWFRTPPRFVEFRGREMPVVAHIERPDRADIIWQPSAALQVKHDWGSAWASRVSYGYKPVAQTRIAYDFYVRATETTPETVVNLHPDFPYEHISTFETDFIQGPWLVSAGVTYQDPQVKERPYEWVSQDMPHKTTGSIIVRRNLDAYSAQGGAIYGGVTKVWQETPRDKGEIARSESNFERREPFYAALRLGYESRRYRVLRRDLRARVEGTYDIEQEAALLRTAIAYIPFKNLQAEVGMNAIGPLQGNKAKEYDNAYLRVYRANDEVNLKVSYVF